MTDLILSKVEGKIITLRQQQVILANDVAELYGVETREVVQAIKNNPDKFPEGYVFDITPSEKEEVIKIFDNLSKLRFSPSLPKAFTEKGLYMLATILKSRQAVQTTLAIVETFAKLRELARTVALIPSAHEQSEQKSLLRHCSDVLDDLITQNMPVKSSETSLELNFAMFKLKHTIKREEE